MADLHARSTAPLRVLLVEGDPDARMVLTREIEALGHAVRAARDTDEAWTDLLDHDADVALLDWPTPAAGVLDLCERVRARESESDRPYTWVVVVPPPADRTNVEAALAAGADAFLVKPIDAIALHAALVAAGRFIHLDGESRAARREVSRREEQLREEARRDPLTRLGNRVKLEEDLRRVRSGVQRYGHRWAAVLIDVDQFRRYNEIAGRPAGDDVLRRVAGAVGRTLRDGDSAYRYGGEQLLVLLPEQGEDGGVIVAHRCRAAVAALGIPHPRSDVGDRVTVSAGVAELEGSTAEALEAWLRRADLALYAAKAAGRNGVARSGNTHLAGMSPAG
jgi:diguanylate cyclase (GGDEF)-like protein